MVSKLHWQPAAARWKAQEVIFLGGMGSMRNAKCCHDKLTCHRVTCGLSWGHTATIHSPFLELE